MTATPDDLAFVLESVTAGSAAPNERVHAIEQENRPWVHDSRVQGLGIGHKITDGAETDDLALRVYVSKKEARRNIEHPAPATIPSPGPGRIKTDVIEIGPLTAELFTGTSDPLAAGAGVGNLLDANVGTIGALVTRRHNGAVALLSNSHVLARDGVSDLGEGIVQPAVPDGGEAGTHVVGRLAGFERFTFSDLGFPNLVDAAIAELGPDRRRTCAIRLLGKGPSGVTTNLRRGMHVHKVGRTSDLTTGIIQDVHFKMHLQLRRSKTRRARVGFRDQVLCTRFTEKGDSGSLVLSSSGRAVGLHFAGSISASVFNRIDNVLDALDIELVMAGVS